MDKLYAPWRDRYVMSANKTSSSGACVFCEIFDGQAHDEQRYVLYKNSDVAVLLNLYPYNGGHLLIISKYHHEYTDQLPDSVVASMMLLSSKSMQILSSVLNCAGFNFGANIGKVSGAGIPEHVHFHVVPRFAGDTGFFTTIGDSKPVSVDLHELYKKLQPHFKTLNI